MTGKLTFAVNAQERDKISADTGATAVKSISDIHDLSSHLARGGEAVAVMSQVNWGFRLPEGVEVAFTESCPKDGADRIQAEARAHPGEGIKLRPHQLAAIKAVREMPEGELAERLKSMGMSIVTQEPTRNPYPGEIFRAIDDGTIKPPELPTGFEPDFSSRAYRHGEEKTPVEIVYIGLDGIKGKESLDTYLTRKLEEKAKIKIADEAHHIKDPFRHAKPVNDINRDKDPEPDF